jgi:sugar (pentulose or hexulose) kinase
MSEIFVGIDVGGTNVKIGIFDSTLKMTYKTPITSEADIRPEVIINNMAQALPKICADIGYLVKDTCLVGSGRTRLAKCDKVDKSIVSESNGNTEEEKDNKQTEVADQKNAHISQRCSSPPKILNSKRELNLTQETYKRIKYRLILPSFVINWLANRKIRRFFN